MRILVAFDIINVHSVMAIIKNVQAKILERRCAEDEDFANDTIEDNN